MGLAVRNREGLAYSVGSGLTRALQGGMFLAYCETKSATTYRAVALMREIVAEMREKPVTKEELDVAKESILNGFVAVVESPAMLARQRAVLDLRDYPQDWLDRYRAVVRAMTVEEVQRVAREWLHPDRLRVVVVGDPASLDAAPEDLGPAKELPIR